MNHEKPSGWQIIPAGEEHLPVIAKLAGVIWHRCYPGIISHEQIDYMLSRMYAPKTMLDEIRSQGIHYDLLLADDKPAGFASYGPATESPPCPESHRADVQRVVPVFKLHKLYMLPELHGQGLGSRLLKHVEEEVRAIGGQRLILSVNKRNSKAITAYRRNGFVIAGSVATDIGGGFVMDDYIMEKDFTGPAKCKRTV